MSAEKAIEICQALVERAIYTDSYGVPDSDFPECRLCGCSDGPGLHSRPDWHSLDCPAKQAEDYLAGRALPPDGEPVAKELLEISGAESVEEALDIFRRERIANGHMAAEDERLRDGLRWYAERHHYELPEWDSCSGESQNWLFPPIDWENDNSPAWMVDDGGIARAVLNGHSIAPDHEEGDNITIAPDAAPVSNATEEGAKVVAEKCPDGLLPDGPWCPRCGKQRGPSGVDGGSWVHYPDAYAAYATHPLPVDNNAEKKHIRRVVGHLSGWQEQMDTCVCGEQWPCKFVDNNAGEEVAAELRLAKQSLMTMFDAKEDAQAEIERLRKALEEYAEHKKECSVRKYNLATKHCDCGLNAALGVHPAVKAEEGGHAN